MKVYLRINVLLIFLSFCSSLFAQENEEPIVDTSVKISGLWFMAYQGNIPSEGNDSFGLKRGYLTVKKRFNETFSIRYTQDVTGVPVLTITYDGTDTPKNDIIIPYLKYAKVGNSPQSATT
ncbi:MAG: hypothetical protein KAH15_05570 [Candidatus Marinimicrobia bacterium]|nr:hypothetical protein [Candidatus Neomarinimicrobiota bacterium]